MAMIQSARFILVLIAFVWTEMTGLNRTAVPTATLIKPSNVFSPDHRRSRLRCALLGSVLWLGVVVLGMGRASEAQADDFLAAAFEEERLAVQLFQPAQATAYHPESVLTLTALLAKPAEHTWLFQPDYVEDLTQQVALLIDTTPIAPLVAAALEHLGVRYRWGGNSPKSGFDCSGLVVYAARESLGLQLPRTAATQARTGMAVKKSELQAGDLVFFNTRGARYSHVGIYAGDGKFIHAPRTGAVVRVESMRSSYWSQRYTGARRLQGVQLASAK